jgi:formylmethanofuran dehydrogenase subunit E
MGPTHPSLAAAARFHGHLGPWLALGLKAGLRVRRELAASPFQLFARVYCPAKPPHSCFLDGVQFGSGCTLGKGNIRHVRADGCRVEFARNGHGGQRRAGDRLVLDLRREVWEELHNGREDGWEAGVRLGRQIYRRPFEALFVAHRG